jgi:hypothetical protein
MDLVHIVVRDLHAGELIFDRDHQFHAIEPVGTEIVGEVCVIRDAFDADAQCWAMSARSLPDPRPSFIAVAWLDHRDA